MTISARDIGQKELPAGWKWVQIEDVCTVILGQSPPGSTYRQIPDGLPFFQGKADFGDVSPHATVWCVVPNKIAEAGDILMSVRAPVGPTNLADTKCCIGRGLAALRCNEQADRDFVLSGLKLFETQIARMGAGSTFSAITGKQLREIPLPLPPLEEQKRIAGILNEQMSAVEEAKKAAQERLEAAQALPAAYLREVFPSSEEKLPAGWKWVKLGDVVDITIGRTPSRNNPEYWSDGNHPWVSIADIRGDVITQTKESITDVGAAVFKNRVVSKGTLIFSFKLSIGKTAFAGCDLFTNEAIAGLVPKDFAAIDTKFLRHALATVDFDDATGHAVKGKTLNLKSMSVLPIPLPPLEEQKRIAAELDDKMAGVKLAEDTIQQELDTIEAMPASLLREAFSGGLS